MSVPSDRPETAPNPPAATPAPDDARRPRSLADRLRLFLLLIVLPALFVCIPVAVQTYFFGQRPAPKQAHTEGLQKTLEQSANNLLPAPPALGPDPLVVTARADHLAARMEKISKLAQAFGGSASEGLSTPAEKRLSVGIPAGKLEAFKQAVSSNTSPTALPSVAPASSGGRDYIDIIIRAAGADE